MKIEKIARPILNCDNHRLTTAVYKLDICFDKQPIYLCDSCLEKLKSLEVANEKIYEWQWTYKLHDHFYITTDFYTNESDVRLVYAIPIEYITKIELSKRERKQ